MLLDCLVRRVRLEVAAAVLEGMPSLVAEMDCHCRDPRDRRDLLGRWDRQVCLSRSCFFY